MKIQDSGFCLQYQSEKVYLVGFPIRSMTKIVAKAKIDGVNTTRLKFTIFSMDLYYKIDDDDAADRSTIGECELYVDKQGIIRALVNIKLKPKFRKCGYGRTIIEEMLTVTENGLHIFDVKNTAKGFWSKMGITYNNDRTTEKKLHGKIDKHIA